MACVSCECVTICACSSNGSSSSTGTTLIATVHRLLFIFSWINHCWCQLFIVYRVNAYEHNILNNSSKFRTCLSLSIFHFLPYIYAYAYNSIVWFNYNQTTSHFTSHLSFGTSFYPRTPHCVYVCLLLAVMVRTVVQRNRKLVICFVFPSSKTHHSPSIKNCVPTNVAICCC